MRIISETVCTLVYRSGAASYLAIPILLQLTGTRKPAGLACVVGGLSVSNVAAAETDLRRRFLHTDLGDRSHPFRSLLSAALPPFTSSTYHTTTTTSSSDPAARVVQHLTAPDLLFLNRTPTPTRRQTPRDPRQGRRATTKTTTNDCDDNNDGHYDYDHDADALRIYPFGRIRLGVDDHNTLGRHPENMSI
ncbi:hypothetical protein CSOJ01_00298 [Colletotrichum sojae]|uniref:Uncharacterized protein n=1 Tax=Colletotrichum sojae TaxID=2175907 RepID=A0A8H6JXI2_9PEZI|nr:hypothetical protein CSOJ01_00298 [Colletotrichum sojae]